MERRPSGRKTDQVLVRRGFHSARQESDHSWLLGDFARVLLWIDRALDL